jgi:glycerol dehydrogenase
MNRIIIAPGRYVQGPGVLANLAEFVAPLGGRLFVIGGATAIALVREAAAAGLDSKGLTAHWETHPGDCTIAASEALAHKAREMGTEVVVGAGGGRAIDTAKAVSHELACNLVIAPTVAASDAACSALAVQHNDQHMIERFLILRRNPDLVLVDSQVIARAPTRFFVAGMGDALATWFEANTCTKSMAQNLPGGISTNAALTLARLCFDTLMTHGKNAKLAVDQDAVTPAVEAVIEANTLLSGLGFESGGLAAAHGIHEGLQVLEGTAGRMHGELVAFGALCQMVMENHPPEDIDRVMDFCLGVGLPIRLAHLGVTDTSPAHLMRAAEVACGEGLTTHNSYFPVTPDLVKNAIIGADALGAAKDDRAKAGD